MNKKLGTIRRLDSLGRIVIPKGMRRALDIATDDEVNLALEGNVICVTKLAPTCALCGSAENLVEFGDKKLCRACVMRVKTQL